MSQTIVPTKTYLAVFGALMALLAITVGVAYVDLGKFNLAAAMAIAVAKAALIVTFFMHLRYGRRLTWGIGGRQRPFARRESRAPHALMDFLGGDFRRFVGDRQLVSRHAHTLDTLHVLQQRSEFLLTGRRDAALDGHLLVHELAHALG
jgi:caa(3)-type oxidase subunit IV